MIVPPHYLTPHFSHHIVFFFVSHPVSSLDTVLLIFLPYSPLPQTRDRLLDPRAADAVAQVPAHLGTTPAPFKPILCTSGFPVGNFQTGLNLDEVGQTHIKWPIISGAVPRTPVYLSQSSNNGHHYVGHKAKGKYLVSQNWNGKTSHKEYYLTATGFSMILNFYRIFFPAHVTNTYLWIWIYSDFPPPHDYCETTPQGENSTNDYGHCEFSLHSLLLCTYRLSLFEILSSRNILTDGQHLWFKKNPHHLRIFASENNRQFQNSQPQKNGCYG